MLSSSASRSPLRRPVRGLIFDMDGTIVDTRAYHMAAWRQFVAHLGLEHRHYRVAETSFGKTNWDIFDEWFDGQRNGHDYDRLSEQKEQLFRELIAGRQPPRPGMIELLQSARQAGLKVALCTSGPRANAEFLLRDLAIERYFDAVLWGDATIKGKPNPDPFLKVAGRLGLNPQQCVGFEDSRFGFLAVRRAGMRLVAIAETPKDLVTCRKWTPHVFQDFIRVPQLLARWM